MIESTNRGFRIPSKFEALTTRKDVLLEGLREDLRRRKELTYDWMVEVDWINSILGIEQNVKMELIDAQIEMLEKHIREHEEYMSEFDKLKPDYSNAEDIKTRSLLKRHNGKKRRQKLRLKNLEFVLSLKKNS